jgi:hypothetical protein
MVNWKKQRISSAVKHPGALRKQLWTKPWKKISVKLLGKVAKAGIWSKVAGKKVTGKLKKRAVLAKTLSTF